MGKSSAPSPDPQIGVAAKMSAETGKEYLAFMRDQAKITNAWADEDRARYQNQFLPLEDKFVAEAQAYDTPGRRADAATAAVADVSQQSAVARAASDRRMAAMGVDPRSGAFAAEGRRTAMAEGLGAAGAANLARRQVEAEGQSRIANAVNLGKGLAVNPISSMQTSNNATAAGFQGAMSGYNQQGSLLNTQYQNQLSAWKAQNDSMMGIGQALGMVAGALPFTSDKKAKKNKRPAHGVLEAIEGMPAERWQYRKGVADEAEHIGPYAQDFKRETGLGDGRTINPIDMMGVTLAGVQELAREVRDLKKSRKKVH